MVQGHGRRRAAGLTVLALSLLAGLLTGAAPAQAYPGAPWLEPDKVYTENFADPSVLRVGNEYYAYATGTGGSYLPVMRSTDLQTWTPRTLYDPGDDLLAKWPGFNDALPWVAPWGLHPFSGSHMTSWVMAPGVERFGDTYVAYYALIQQAPDRFCISVATSSSPIGPFLDRTTAPLVCDGDAPGSIDPAPFIDPATGIGYLTWASEGPGGNPPTKLWSRQLSADGLGFAPGSAAVELTRTTQPWEGLMIENPSMVRHDGQIYLLYSANDWWTDRYAIGYATCSSPLGPCTKPSGGPLLASDGVRQGPGGPSAFTDAEGRLRMAYHHWTAPWVGYPTDPNCDGGGHCTSQGQRRLAITELSAGGGRLQVGAPRPTPPVLTPERACPSGVVPEDGFVDLPASNLHESAVDCVAWWGVAQGFGNRYEPAAGVSRGQMASFLARAVLSSGGSLPEQAPDAFADDNGSPHEGSINRLAAAGLVGGVDKHHYRPDLPVSRAQMAALLVRSVEHRTGRRLEAGQDWFSDDDHSVHRTAIDAAASSGLASGTGGGAFSPAATVRRDQMASFLARQLETFVQAGAELPARR